MFGLRKRTARFAIGGALALGILLALPGDSFAQGCSMCASSLQDPEDPLARSISRSIVFMASMPFLLFATVAGWIYWRLRNHEEAEEDDRR